MQETVKKPHNVLLDCRRRLSLTGVTDVIGFNDEAVSLSTSMGDLYVRGEKLHISKLNLDSGEVEIDGVVSSFQYAEQKQSKGLVRRLFR